MSGPARTLAGSVRRIFARYPANPRVALLRAALQPHRPAPTQPAGQTLVALQSVEAGLARVPRSIDDTARLLGATPQRVFVQLHLPLLRRSALAAALLVFVDVMKELPATLVLRPFGSDTLAVVAYNLARDERLGEAALPSLAIVAVGLLPVVLLSRALRQK